MRHAQPTGPRVAKRRCLVILLLMFVVSGAVDPFIPDGSRVSLVLTLPAAAAILMWCLYDGAERSCHIKLPMRILSSGPLAWASPSICFAPGG